jgi:hypothetical protein
MATREDVLIRFGGDAKGVNATLASIRTSISGLSSMFASLGVGVGVGALASAFKDTLSWADDLVETADRVGLTTEAVQALRLEAELFGVSTEEVDSALTKFSINLGKARQGTGDLFKVMQQYNKSISGSDVEAIKAYIGLLQNATNAAEQNRIAVAGFGKAGAKMAQAIAESNIPLDQMVQKFQKLGMVMEDDGARKLSELNDEFDRLKQKGGAAFKTFVVNAVKDLGTLGSGFSRIGVILSHWASGDFIGMDQVVAWENQAKDSINNIKNELNDGETGTQPGDASKGFKTYTEGLVTARQDAATKTKSITQQEFTYESEILNQYNQEVLALRNGQTEAAEAAQAAQESAFRKLADISKGGYALQYYENLVGEIGKKPVEMQASIKMDPESYLALSLGMKEALTAGGASIVTVPIKPYIVWGDTVPGETTPITLPEGQGITREVDQTGANP